MSTITIRKGNFLAPDHNKGYARSYSTAPGAFVTKYFIPSTNATSRQACCHWGTTNKIDPTLDPVTVMNDVVT